MIEHAEQPETRQERYLVIALAAGDLLLGGLLVWLIVGSADRAHPVEFVGLILLLAFGAYLGLLFRELTTVRYELGEQRFGCAQGFRQITLDLTRPTHLQRWLNRWGGSERAARELGVEAVDHFPPLSLFHRGAVWVVTGWDTAGTFRAVALRPSPRLLALLREWAVPRWEDDHG